MKIRMLIFLILLALTFPVSAQENQSSGVIKSDKIVPDFDGWSITHTAGGAGQYMLMRAFGVQEKESLVFTILGGYAWEFVVDGMQLNVFSPDPAGADFIGDPLWWALGGAIACGLDLLFQVHDKINVSANKDRFSISMRLNLNG